MIPFTYANQELAFPCGMDKPRGVFTPLLAARHEAAHGSGLTMSSRSYPLGRRAAIMRPAEFRCTTNCSSVAMNC